MSLISNKTGMQPNPILKTYPLYATTTGETPSEEDAKQQTPAAETPESGTAVAEMPETSLRKETGDLLSESPSAENPAKEETPLPQNSERMTVELQKGTESALEAEEGEKAATGPNMAKTTSLRPSEDLGSSPISPESISADTISSPTNTSTEEIEGALGELHRRAEDASEKASSLLLMENLLKTELQHNSLVQELTESLATFKAELSEESKKQKTELECEMTELRRCLVATMQTYSECLSLKTNGIHSRIEESLDKLEMNSNCLCEGTRKLIEEDRTVIHRIPAIVEEELTRAANETSGYVEGALEKTVGKYTNEIKVSTKFLKKQVEERKKASRFEKMTDVLMRVFCPILALGTFVLTCAVACLV